MTLKQLRYCSTALQNGVEAVEYDRLMVEAMEDRHARGIAITELQQSKVADIYARMQQEAR